MACAASKPSISRSACEFKSSAFGNSPARAAVATFAAFILAGFVPLLAFVYEIVLVPGQVNAFRTSVAMTGMTFFAIGVLKSRFVGQPWYRGGIEVLAIGGGAALLAYGLGMVLKDVGVGG